jgi:hypothetical protein
VRAVIAVPAAPGMKNEQKRVKGIVRDKPIVATNCQLDPRYDKDSLPAGVVLSIAILVRYYSLDKERYSPIM